MAETSRSAVPQEFVLDLLGLHALGRGQATHRTGQPVPTHVFLSVLGISDSATRTTLNRMVARRARMFSPAPFDHAEASGRS
ncbi:hypothetical protein GCM10010306_060580 [Streptomyces umbrinus]|nr:hypothetical protein GCM10010306_060580 [Streptomyces umbrinus]